MVGKAGLCLLADISVQSLSTPNQCQGSALAQEPASYKAQSGLRASLSCYTLDLHSRMKRLLSTRHGPCMEKIPPLVCSHLYPPAVN